MIDALQLTKQLVAFKSPSHVSNREVSEFIAAQLDALGFEIECTCYKHEDNVEKVNVVGRKGPRKTADPGLAYFCHSDVVPADTWTAPGSAFAATERDGHLYGRGSCDMKGSAACMLTAIARLHSEELSAPLHFVCTADEEISYLGAKHLIAESTLYREMVQWQTRALIGEPTELEVVHAHKGICGFQVTSHGEAAHSGTREGRNANLAIIPFLQEMKAIHDETEASSVWQNDEFDPPSVSWNIGINDHTKAINVKPAQSICTVFYRPLPGIDDDRLLERTKSVAAKHGLEFTFHSRCDAVYTDPQNPFVLEALELANQSKPQTVSYGTDAGELTELRNKIICGPGSIAQAHKPDEWIDLQQLADGTNLYERFLRRWCLADK